MAGSDELLFAADDAVETSSGREDAAARGAWKVLLVDDEKEVHNITKIALGDFQFEGKGIEFVHAYSAREANALIAEHPDTALILLDVVMEAEDAGLRVVKYIREVVKNRMARIILRTGQPGQAPERKVIVDYDINDYKTKTELTSQKLYTTVVAALRAYRDIKIIDNNKKGLEKIIDASSSIFELKSLEKFIVGALTQITGLLYLEENAAVVTSFAACEQNGELVILAGTGQYADKSMRRVSEAASEDVFRCLRETVERGATQYYDDRCVIYFKTKSGTNNMIFLQGTSHLTDWDKNLLDIFCGNIAVALDNIYLIDRIVQKELETERHKMETEKACEALSRYVSPQIAGEILLKGLNFGGERTRATVLFFDIRNFTAFSENLHAEEVVRFLNELFSDIVDIIFEHAGTLDKFLGDGLMAVFGVPLSTGADELNAVSAALKIRDAVNEINRLRVLENQPPIKFGIGIHTGDVVAGNVGSKKRVDYTVIGRSVNLASRVESLTKHFNTDILITQETFDKVKDHVECSPLEAVAVKGIQQPVTTFSVSRQLAAGTA
jgi:class 3 adenylate cyclase/DNA-binding NarL/FixJ family response regulator